MKGGLLIAAALLGAAPLLSCDLTGSPFVQPPLETGYSFLNLSTEFYAAFEIRESGTDDAFAAVPLLAPGALSRGRFADLIDAPCPAAVDLRIKLYARVDADVPIGLDDGEMVGSTPVVSGEIGDLPACAVTPLESYTVVNWDAPEGTARVKIAQGTDVETEIRRLELFDEPDAAWNVIGVDPAVAGPAPAVVESEPIAGTVVSAADGSPVEGAGVLLRTRFRVRLDDDDDGNNPDSGFGDPIAFATTDADGAFEFRRPAGAYLVEFFSDDLLFRPDQILVESPLQVINVVAEPVE